MNSPKINYYEESLKEIEAIKKEGKRPKLLMHVCCGPCSTYPLEFLKETFDVTVFFNNSNIYPSEEYYRRLNELDSYLKHYRPDVTLLTTPYENEAYTKKLEPLKDKGECSERCWLCYSLRMDEAYQYAVDHHFDYFTTVMTISKQKNSQKLNEIGKNLSMKYPSVKYFFSDFKKKDGNLKGNIIAKECGLYRQDYCGCKYSLEERKKLDES